MVRTVKAGLPYFLLPYCLAALLTAIMDFRFVRSIFVVSKSCAAGKNQANGLRPRIVLYF